MKTFKLLFVGLLLAAATITNLSGQDISVAGPLPQIKLAGNAHIDLAYRWRWNETIKRVVPDTFWGVLRMMEQVQGLTFAQSQMALYEQICLNDPDLLKEIKKRIADGTWSVTGNQWSEPDEMLCSGESYIRQFLLGSEFMREKNLAPLSRIVWMPDAFSGHAATLPKIFKGCGMENYLFMRDAPKDMRIFWWEADDGSRVLAYNLPAPYNAKLLPGILDNISEWYRITGYPEALVLYGEGDHGGGPRDTDMEALARLREIRGITPIAFESPEKYFARLNDSGRNWPVFKGELGVAIPDQKVHHTEGEQSGTITVDPAFSCPFCACYTSQAQIKRLNRQAESALLSAETFATIGSAMQGKPFYPRVDFRDAWKILLRNQFHDILPGTCVGDAADDARDDLESVIREAERLQTFGLETIGSRIETRGAGFPIVMYNPLAWNRTALTSVYLRFAAPVQTFSVKDAAGNDVPYVIDSSSADRRNYRITLLAEDLPSTGFRMVRAFAGQRPKPVDGVKSGKNFAENEYYRVKWNNVGVTSIVCKETGRELLNGTGNQLKLLETKSGSAWGMQLSDITVPFATPASVQMVENTPLRVTVQWEDVAGDSRFVRQMMIEKGMRQVKFRILADWYEHDCVLKVFFPVAVKNGTATYENPYGYIERPLLQAELPAQNWIDLSGDDWGISMFNDGRNAFTLDDGVMGMTVLYNSRDMDPRMDHGQQEVCYALAAHTGGWRGNRVVQRAMEFNRPAVARQEYKHSARTSGWTSGVALGDEESFYGIADNDHVIISAIKVLQENWAPEHVVLRIFETEGRDGMVTVRLPSKPLHLVESDHIENPLPVQPEIIRTDNSFSFAIGHNQIRTFIIRFGR